MKQIKTNYCFFIMNFLKAIDNFIQRAILSSTQPFAISDTTTGITDLLSPSSAGGTDSENTSGGSSGDSTPKKRKRKVDLCRPVKDKDLFFFAHREGFQLTIDADDEMTEEGGPRNSMSSAPSVIGSHTPT